MIGEKRHSENRRDELGNQLRGKFISLSVPAVRQETGYTCAPASLKAVFAYYGTQVDESEIAKACQTTEKDGTSYRRMIETVGKFGFVQESKNRATIDEIQREIDGGTPVIVAYMLNNHDETSLPGWIMRNASKVIPDFKKLGNLKERFVVAHCSVVFGYDDQNLFVLNVATGKQVRYNKKEFAKDWYDDEGRKWMMAINRS